MKKQPTQRQKDELARRKAMGIALIIRPLRLIAAKTNRMERDAQGNLQKVESSMYKTGRFFAMRGWGGSLQHLARQVV